MPRESMRLDRYLTLEGEYSRKEAGQLLKSGHVCVNGVPEKSAKAQVKAGDEITLNGKSLHNQAYHFYIMNKPAGVLTAARDSHAPTVMDLLPESFLHKKILPVGRLDKDSTGLLLFTNDGTFGHKLISPKNHVLKRYLVTVEGCLGEEHIPLFEAGMDLGDFVTQPATLEILLSGEATSTAIAGIHEGKYHQVKRMFAHIGHEVQSLHRVSFGPLALPEDLLPGQYRALKAEEVALLEAAVQASIPAE